MGVKGCWTCRERKVRCDLRLPKCNNCIKAKRTCQGYGIQLSWPRNGDQKRAIISRDTRGVVNLRHTNVRRFLHSSTWDVSLSEEILDGRSSAHCLRTMRVPHPIYLSPTILNREESHLLDFFRESRSLTLGPTDEEVLAQFIMKVAFSEPSNATNSVLQSVLALASLQLHGGANSFRYKRLAVASVAKQSVDWLDEKALLQKLTTAMLLYHYELSLGSDSKAGWVVFLCAVKRIINTAPAVHKLIRQEYSVFLDWIFYHEAISEFTVRHWCVPYEGCGFTPIPRSPKIVGEVVPKAEANIGCPTDVLQLMVHACQHALVTRFIETNLANEEKKHTNMLEKNIAMATGNFNHLHVSSIPMNRNLMISNLHRLACLVYVNRTVHCISETDFRHRRLVRESISLLTNMKTCQNAWPLFIIACEAVEDDPRLAILDVFEQSQQDQRRRSSHIHLIQHMVEAVWKQRDLDTESQVDYLTILDTVVRAVPFMPVFA